jgi:hypothetical protein
MLSQQDIEPAGCLASEVLNQRVNRIHLSSQWTESVGLVGTMGTTKTGQSTSPGF